MLPTDVAWDLEPLVNGEGAVGVDRLLDEASDRADAFAARYAGRVQELSGDELVSAIGEVEELADHIGRAGSYASLRFSADTQDPANGALLQRVSERATAIQTKLVFFDLEWAALDDDKAEELLGDRRPRLGAPSPAHAAPRRPHLLTEPEERILAEKSVTGADAWGRLFDELTRAIEVELPGAEAPSPSTSRSRSCRATTATCVAASPRP